MNTNKNLQQFQNVDAGATMGRCIYLMRFVSHRLGNTWIDAMIAPRSDF